MGTIELAIPRIRTGSYFPSLLEPRRRAERALQAVVQEAYVHGVSARKADDLLKAPGMGGTSKSRRDVPQGAPGRPCAGDGDGGGGGGDDGGRAADSGRECWPSEDGPFWTAFLRSPVKRGLRGVKLVISDAHEGLRKALCAVLSGASWQHCRVHFMRNLLPEAGQVYGPRSDLPNRRLADLLAEQYICVLASAAAHARPNRTRVVPYGRRRASVATRAHSGG